MAVPPCTISILDPDILWSIFMMNADMFTIPQPRPLETARHTSQVCRLWRDLMINSPTIWGNILDLRDLKGEVNRWREEVMTRTGNALLSIKGLITGPTMFRIVQAWLDDNWERIRVLDVWELDNYLFKRMEWKALVRHAPALESFRIHPWPVYLIGKAAVLFDDRAPSLRQISFNFEIQTSSWVKNIRDVTFCKPFSIRLVLDILFDMPWLESLALEDMAIINSNGVPRKNKDVVIPHLINFAIGENSGSYEDIIYLLQSITPAVNCALKVHHLRTLAASSGSTLDAIISRFAHNTFSNRRAQSIGLFAWHDNCVLDVRHDTEIIHDPRIQSSSFYLDVGWTGRDIIMTNVIRPFFSKDISAITTFDFIIDDDLWVHNKRAKIAMLQEIVQGFSSVERLRVSEPSLRFLLDNIDPTIMVASGSEIAFPLLYELRVANKTEIHQFMRTISRFLLYRAAHGGMIDVLDITEYAQRRTNWGFLEDFTGLKVVWNIRDMYFEYICGSGDPSKLGL